MLTIHSLDSGMKTYSVTEHVCCHGQVAAAPELWVLLQSQMQQLYDKAVRSLHTALDEPEGLQGRLAEVDSAPPLLVVLKTQADGAEAAGDVVAASRYHLERCTVAPTDMQVRS